MDTQTSIIIGQTLFKLFSLFVGFGSCWMGYKLFISGIWGNAGEIEGTFENNRLVVKKAAPGTFFALFGTIVIVCTIWKGLKFDHYSETREGREGLNTKGTPYENLDYLSNDEPDPKAPPLPTPIK